MADAGPAPAPAPAKKFGRRDALLEIQAQAQEFWETTKPFERDAPADGDRRGRRPAREHARREGPAGGGRPRLEWPGHLGSGRIVASATEAPILLANLE